MDELGAADIALVRAANPGPFTLEGTNTWVVGRDPCWVVDPGPHLDEHVGAVAAETRRRGGLGGVVLTHGHGDHSDAVAGLLAKVDEVPVAAAGWAGAGVRIADGQQCGPFTVVATPGHSLDHVAFLARGVLFSGDAVLGRGSVFIYPDPGALRSYLAALEHLLTLDIDVICPGHGPLVTEPRAKLEQYRDHRLDRERRLLEALQLGLRSADELLDHAWADAPSQLRPAAMVTLAAHLDKLGEEGVLPQDVERPVLRLPSGG